MQRRSGPILRITIGLAGLTASLLLTAQLLGLVPDETRAILDSRRKFAETLTVQISSQAGTLQVAQLQIILDAIVERNRDVRSAALRDAAGKLLVSSGDHATAWQPPPNGQSTADDVQVPVYSGSVQWGNLELAFTPMPRISHWNPIHNPVLLLILFMAASGSIGYFLVLRRSLKALDPNAVIPGRVRAALDSLVEGVLILDENEQVVLANNSFARRLGVTPPELVGHNISNLNWRTTESGGLAAELPWRAALQTREVQTAKPLSLRSANGDIRTFMVNGTPILEGDGPVRGVLATFDDVTDLEQRNSDLQAALAKLKDSQNKIELQNSELQFLATRDPLTGCLNRRSLFAQFEPLFARSRSENLPLTCAMIDIDHFKLINDRYGHATGDKVIARVAEILRSNIRERDILARYGGEEFCLVLAGTDPDTATAILDRMRETIAADSSGRFTTKIGVTVSAGIAGLPSESSDAASLINQADTALYAAKQGGRNRVIRWAPDQTMSTMGPGSRPQSAEPRVEAGATVRIQSLNNQIAELEAHVERQSSAGIGQDPVTGLANRALFEDRVSQLIARSSRRKLRVGILHIDVDLFQRFTDVLGPAAGEQLIRAVADRLSNLFRRSDTLALIGHGAKPATVSRLAGDEFGVAIEDLDRVESLTWIVQRVFNCLASPFSAEGQEVFATCGIGVSIYPEDGTDASILLRHASSARQHARQKLGPNRYAFYAREMTEQSQAQIRLESELRHAVERAEFVLHYQPKVVISTGQLSGVEALLRWQHPERGLVRPGDFMPLAEQTGLINPIGDWVIRKACSQAALWQRMGLTPTRVAVNLSPVQLRTDDIVERIQNVLQASELAPHYLEIEITESALMEDIGHAARILNALRKLGVHIALDDFGTGYSSLSYLKKLPADSLKIDGSFIDDLAVDKEGNTLVSAMIAMAQHLGIRVVAEGVETREQFEHLRDLNCDEVQGYLVGKPMPASEIATLLRQATPWRFRLEDSVAEGSDAHLATGTAGPNGNLVFLNSAARRRAE
jgi:diguanylate cyclase (GGDEF)-like protein/PAS domain S-box-containing protein